MVEVVRELVRFMLVRKKFWLIPVFVMFLVFGGLIILTEGTAVSPFIYAIF